MVCITLPNGAERVFPAPVTGTAIAASISPSLARKAAAMRLDGHLRDLADAITANAIWRSDP